MQNFHKLFNIAKFRSFNKLNIKKFCSNNSDYFIPPTRILFQNGISNIYTYTGYESIKKGYILVTGVLFFISYKSLDKLYNFRERNIFGFIFYGGIALFLVPKLHSLPKTFNKIIGNIDLCKDGKHVIIKHANYGFLNQYKKIDIQQIAKPVDQETVQFVQFGFPLLLDGELYYLPRDNDQFNKEVLPAVLNGKYIDVGDFEDEINI